MAKVGGGGGLAAELAKQASQAALAEFAGDSASAPSRPSGWVVPKLGTFDLENALSTAYEHAQGYMNFMLSPEGLVVDVQQASHETQASVRDEVGNRVYRRYAGEDLLKMYALQRGGKGIVADGQV